MICTREPNDPKHANSHASYWGQVPNISADAQALIARYQPCAQADSTARASHPLVVLERLNVVDKHRLSIGLGTLGRLTSIRVDGSPMELAIAGPVVAGTSNRGEAVLARGTLPNVGTVGVEFDASVQIAFKDVGAGQSQAVIPTLDNLLTYVRSLTADFRNNCPEFTA